MVGGVEETLNLHSCYRCCQSCRSLQLQKPMYFDWSRVVSLISLPHGFLKGNSGSCPKHDWRQEGFCVCGCRHFLVLKCLQWWKRRIPPLDLWRTSIYHGRNLRCLSCHHQVDLIIRRNLTNKTYWYFLNWKRATIPY